MKVVHVIKKIEDIDNDIRELKKLEKSVKKNKSFTNPIFMSIEKQINILLGERIKMLDLKIENPPETMRKEIEGDEKEEKPAAKPLPALEKKKKEPKPKKSNDNEAFEDDIPILTQDQIDVKINLMEAEKEKNKKAAPVRDTVEQKPNNDASVKILDIALEKGTLADTDEKKDKDKDKDKKVKFFRDNFPVE